MNHFFKAIERSFSSHGGNIMDVGWYAESIRKLLLQPEEKGQSN